MRFAVIDRYGEIPNDKAVYQSALKVYQRRKQLAKALVIAGAAMGLSITSLSGPVLAIPSSLIVFGVAGSLMTWSSWANKKLKNSEWTISNHVPVAILQNASVKRRALNRRFALLPT